MRPESEKELAELLRDAKGPLAIQGGGTRDFGNPVVGQSLSTSGISGIELYEPGALTLVVKAGTPVAEVEKSLAKEGQILPFEPMDHRPLLGTKGTPTIGGVAAANVSGPRRIQAGACRDFMLGVRFVDGHGTVIKNGGRVMKNVTGYDLVKLMAGSHGTLGVLTEFAFKVLPRPETEATLIIHGNDPEQAVATLSRALGSPFSVSGAAHLDAVTTGNGGETRVRIEGMEGSVAYRKDALSALLGEVSEVVEGTASEALWREVRDVTPFAGRSGAVWRVSVKPSDGPILTRQLKEAGLEHAAIFDWGGGLVWLLTDESGDAGAALIRQKVSSLGGHATLVRGPAKLRNAIQVFQPEPAPLAAISAGLRAKFDPRGILNPGLMEKLG